MTILRLSFRTASAVITSHPSKPIQIKRFQVHSVNMSSPTTRAKETSKPVDNHAETPKVYPVQEVTLYRYTPENETWSERTGPVGTDNTKPPDLKSPVFALITWNVDFARECPFARLETSLNHLQSLVEPLLQADPPIPSVIMLQEVYEHCFPVLLKHPFVRAHYDLTAISSRSWSLWYGVVTLAPRSMNVISAFRSVFQESKMGREGLFIDIPFPEGGDVENKSRIVRVANTHLESLDGFGNIARPIQLGIVASFLSVPGIHAGIVGGDMNPIGPDDDAAPSKLGFLDGWIECKQPKAAGEEAASAVDDERQEAEGHTWGYQPRSQWPPRRMDKILFVGNTRVKDIERFGVGLTVHEDKVGGEKVWASDHYGLLAKIEII